MLPLSTLIESINTLVTEAYAGPPDPRSTWFIDNESDSGILGILAGVSAAEASISVDGSGNPGTTIASHAEHLHWSLHNMNIAMKGGLFGNWKESWSLNSANPAVWDRLRAELRYELELLRENLKQQTELPGEYLTGGLALLPHAAYHLGTIRQMVERVRQKSQD
jgi:hypothetical protein